MNEIFTKAASVLEQIEQAGFEAYFVGGSIRDMILGRPIHDVDIATSATPAEIKSIFPKTADVGIEHGTVMVLYRNETYEITTFRAESGYSDYRRPDSVTYIRSLYEDLMRRDFTMNAIAMDKDGRLSDPFEGRRAIEERLIRTVGNPDERFKEDALRMMRALRFVSQLSFTLDHGAFQSLERNGELLTKIAVERIFAEFEKLLKGEGRKEALKMLLDSGLFAFLPGFESKQEGLTKLLALPIEEINEPAGQWSLIIYTFRIQDPEAFLRRWKMPIKLIKEIKRITALLKAGVLPSTSNDILFRYGLHEALIAEKLLCILNDSDHSSAEERVSQAYAGLVIKDMSELAVSGSDLMQWSGKKPGPWIKEDLDRITKAVLEQQSKNEKAAIKEWLLSWNQT
ncbi:CCA tRNA nucleotidyltransferase [Bacillus sp. M6-12]|uniref:CCA tRNA nucleotidyltransferase n=1 Tax=Bacillus sp. M6-12 TaxID=2054166 RepID=UPI000C7608C7|nr:CCA tRNA nucleotidyltransferase [Bacillus sp. M6-12]PLS16418.1 CCA tRNA nucleotidyltransferase [Bacillus sp. M6-12]